MTIKESKTKKYPLFGRLNNKTNFENTIPTKGKEQYKCLLLIAMLFITLMIISALSVHRILKFGPFFEPGGIVIFPLTYFFGDVIAEVYGYRISRQILWYGLLCQFIFSLLMQLILHLPSAPFWHHQASFNLIFSPLIVYSISFTVGTIAGGFINIYIISKVKILVKGRYFWIRSLASTMIGEFIFSVVTLTPVFLFTMPFNRVVGVVLSAYLFKLVYGMFAVLPATFLTNFLKRTENIDVYDYGINYNPFKLDA